MKSKLSLTLINIKNMINKMNKVCVVVSEGMRKILNKKYFNTKLINILLILITTFLLITLFIYRQNVLFWAGNKFFGGKVFKTTLYDIDTAQVFFELADDSKDKNIMWLDYQLSRIHFIRGDLTTAISYADKELVNHPNNCRTNYIRGLAYAYQDSDASLDKAIENFERFNTCFPGTWAGHNDLAWFWFRKGNMEKVIGVVEEVSDKYPSNPWIQNTYGTALMNVGRLTEAKKAFEAAKSAADNMTEETWGAAYPGNNPKIYKKGLEEMRKSINNNLDTIKILNKS